MTTNTYTYTLKGEKRSIIQAPNQRVIQIHNVCEEGHGGVNLKAHKKARAELSTKGFVLYDFFICFTDGLIWSMSSKVLYRESSLRESTYAKAFQELIDKCYLQKCDILVDDGYIRDNAYHFYEDSDKNPSKKYLASLANQKKDEPSSLTTEQEVLKPMMEAIAPPPIKKFEPWKKIN